MCLTATPGGAQTRYRDASARAGGPGQGRGRRGRHRLRGVRLRPAHDRARAGVGDRQLPLLEGAGPVPGAALPGGDLGHGRERPLRPHTGPGASQPRRAQHRRGARCDRDGARAAGRAVARRRHLAVHRDAASGARRGRGGDRLDDPAARRRPSLDGDAVRRGSRHRRGLGALDPGLVAARLPRVRRALRARDVPRAALREADRGLRRLGPRLRPRGARGDDGLVARLHDARAGRGAGLRRALPGPGDPRRRRPHLAARVRAPRRRADRRRARGARGLRPRPGRARPGARQRADRGVRGACARRPADAGAALDARARCAGSARCSSPPRSASATRGATWRSRASCGCSCPASRSTGSPSTR